jgi:hypothetical protein
MTPPAERSESAQLPNLEGEILQRVRGLISAIVVGIPLGIFLVLWLHAVPPFAVAMGCLVGLAIFAVVATRSDAHDDAADLAWRAAAPDLPPLSDRVILEQSQADMPGPGSRRRAVARSHSDGSDARPSDDPSQGAERT